MQRNHFQVSFSGFDNKTLENITHSISDSSKRIAEIDEQNLNLQKTIWDYFEYMSLESKLKHLKNFAQHFEGFSNDLKDNYIYQLLNFLKTYNADYQKFKNDLPKKQSRLIDLAILERELHNNLPQKIHTKAIKV